MSRIPVASTTIAPGRPEAKRPYHSMMFLVTKPSSVARHGTIAGTQVRLSRLTGPMLIGVNSKERPASCAVGQRVSGIACRTGFSGCHMGFVLYQTGGKKAEGRAQKSEVRSL